MPSNSPFISHSGLETAQVERPTSTHSRPGQTDVEPSAEQHRFDRARATPLTSTTVAAATAPERDRLPGGCRDILFIHGLFGSRRQFTDQLAHFSRNGYRVLAVSLPGHDDAEISAADIEGGLAGVVGRVEATLDASGVRSTHIVGHALGGAIGYELLDQLPARVASLTTFGTAARASSLRIHRSIPLAGRRSFRRSQRAASANPKTKTKLVAPRSKGKYSAWNRRNDHTKLLATTTTPVMILYCGRDRRVNRTLASTIAAARTNRVARLVFLPTAGHLANLDVPEQFNADLEQFLRKCREQREQQAGIPAPHTSINEPLNPNHIISPKDQT